MAVTFDRFVSYFNQSKLRFFVSNSMFDKFFMAGKSVSHACFTFNYPKIVDHNRRYDGVQVFHNMT